jgi:hypothetical protein
VTARATRDEGAPRSIAPRSIAPIVGVVVGVPVMAIGVWQAFAVRSDVHPFELARWVVASDLAHDLIAAPIFVAVAWLVGRWLPASVRAPVRWAIATTAILALIAWPFVRGYGRNPTILSLLDRNYATGLVAYVAVVWVLAVVCAAGGVVRAGRSSSCPQEMSESRDRALRDQHRS